MNNVTHFNIFLCSVMCRNLQSRMTTMWFYKLDIPTSAYDFKCGRTLITILWSILNKQAKQVTLLSISTEKNATLALEMCFDIHICVCVCVYYIYILKWSNFMWYLSKINHNFCGLLHWQWSVHHTHAFAPRLKRTMHAFKNHILVLGKLQAYILTFEERPLPRCSDLSQC